MKKTIASAILWLIALLFLIPVVALARDPAVNRVAATNRVNAANKVASANLVAWYDATLLSVAPGANVTTWADSSGNGGPTLTWPGGGTAPVMSTLNGSPAVACTLLDSGLTTAVAPSTSNTYTIMIVFNQTTTNFAFGDQVIASYGTGAGSNGSDYFIKSTNGKLAATTAGGFSSEFVTYTLNTPTVFFLTKTAGLAGTAYIDNVSQGVTGTQNPSSAPAGFRVCPSFTGTIGEVALWNTVLTSQQQAQLSLAMRTKWSIHPNQGSSPDALSANIWYDLTKSCSGSSTTVTGVANRALASTGDNLGTVSGAPLCVSNDNIGFSALRGTTNNNTDFVSGTESAWVLSNTGTFTIGGYLKVNADVFQGALAQDSGGGGVTKWIFGTSVSGSGSFQLHLNNGVDSQTTATASLDTTAFHTYVVSCVAYACQWYIDGAASGSVQTYTSGLIGSSTNTANLGIFRTENTGVGRMDVQHLAVWKSASLTAAQVSALDLFWRNPSGSRPAFTQAGSVPNFNLKTQISPLLAKQVKGNCTDPNVAMWESFDETSGNLTVPTGCAAAGTVFTKNGTPIYSVSAPNGLSSAITFNGSTDYFVTSGDVASLDPLTSPMVVEAWANVSSAGGDIVAKGTSPGWRLFFSSSHVGFSIADGSTTCSASTSSTDTGAYHHIRATWNGSNVCTVTVDNGTAVSTTQTVGSVDNATAVGVGARNGGTNPVTGSIADLRITIGNSTNNLGFNDGTAAVVQPAVNKPGNCTDSNVAAYFSMDDASGNLTVPTGCAAAGTVLTKNGSPIYAQTAPPGLGTAITFDGSASFFQAPNQTTLNPTTGTAVIEGWINTTKTTGNQMIAEQGNFTTGEGWLFWVTGGLLGIETGDTGGAHTCLANGAAVSANAWHYVKGVITATTCAVTVDGGTTTTTTQAAMGSVTTVRKMTIGVGNSPSDAAQVSTYFQGSIADLRITIGNSTNSLGSTFPVVSPLTSTFTRATASTRYNPQTGLVETVATGIPVVGSPLQSTGAMPSGGAQQGIYVGAATTFVLLQNQDFTAVGWTPSTLTVTANQAVAPDGTATADKLAPTGAQSLIWRNTAAGGCLNAVTCTGTVWLRTVSDTTTASLQLCIADNAHTACRATQAITVTPTWQRFTITGTGQAGDGQLAFFIGHGSGGWGVGEDLYGWGAEMYQKAFAIPLDPAVAGSTVTVNADAPSYANAAANNDLGSICVWGYPHTPDNGTHMGILSWDGTNHFNIYESAADGKMDASTTGLVNNLSFASTSSLTANVWNQVCFTYAQATSATKFYQNGVDMGGAQDTWSAGGAYGTTPVIGNTSAGNFGGFLSGVRIYNRVLSASEIAALYTAESSVYAIASSETYRRVEPMLAAIGLDLPAQLRAYVRHSQVHWVHSKNFPQPVWTMPQEDLK